jgi:hypothetical protein
MNTASGHILVRILTNVMFVGRFLNNHEIYRNTGGLILVRNLTNVMFVGRHLNG